MAIKALYTGKFSFEQFYKGMDFIGYDPGMSVNLPKGTITVFEPKHPNNRIVITIDDLTVSGNTITGGTVVSAVMQIGGKTALQLSGLSGDATELKNAANMGTTGLYEYLNDALVGNMVGTGDKYDNLIEVGSGGTMTIDGRGGDDTISVWHNKSGTIDGGSGIDMLEFLSFTGDVPEPDVGAEINLTTGVIVNPFGGTITISNIEHIVGSTQADIIIGNDKANIIGDGFFDGGADQVDAKGGNDIVKIGFDADGASYDGGDGKDELQLMLPETGFTLDARGAEITTSSGDYTIKNFEIYSVNLDVYIGTGLFTFYGSDSDEKVTGSTAEQSNGGALAGRDHIYGIGGQDTLRGLSGNDWLWGGEGNDTLVGGKGADLLRGEEDADRFVYLTLADSKTEGTQQDDIADFSHDEGDIIDVDALDANAKKKNDQDFKFIGDDKFHGKAGELHFVVVDGAVRVEGDVDGDKKADFAIFVGEVASLVKGDFDL